MFLDAIFADEYTVCAVEIFDRTTEFVVRKLCMMPADKLALDINLIVRGPAGNDATGLEKVF
jgi:hypothetical protein